MSEFELEWSLGYAPLSNTYYFYTEREEKGHVVKNIVDIQHNRVNAERILYCLNYCKSLTNKELIQKVGECDIPNQKPITKKSFNQRILA